MDTRLRRVDEVRWRIAATGEMRVDGLVFADDGIMEALGKDRSLQQVANVACLAGIVRHSLAMPAIHRGYGFPIGGVAALDEEEGVVSPGGVGYDIDCGVRLLRSDPAADAAAESIEPLVEGLFHALPSGVGARRSDVVLDRDELVELPTGGPDGSWSGASAGRTTSTPSRTADACRTPIRAFTPRGPRTGAPTRWAPWAPAATSPRSRPWRRSTTRRRRTPSGWSPAGWPS